jgi:hypothetical protein
MRGRGVLLVFVILLLVGVSLAASGTAGNDDGSSPSTHEVEDDGSIGLLSSVGTTTNQIQWSTKASGDRAIRLSLQFSMPTGCGFMISSAGWMSNNHVFHYTGQDREGRSWTAVTNDALVTTHATTASVRSGQLSGDIFVGQSIHTFAGVGIVDWLFAGFDLLPGIQHSWVNGESLVFNLQCNDPFTIIGIQAGRQVTGFIPTMMTGGAGIQASSATVNVLDQVHCNFAGPDVVLRFRNDPVTEAGLLQLSTPAGASSHILTGGTDVFIDGSAGTYRADLTRAALDARSGAGLRTVGIIASLQDVASLDDAANL